MSLVYVGFALAVRSRLGVGPFNVLQQGTARQLGVSLGHAGWFLGCSYIALGGLLGRRPGVATALSVFGGGIILDVALDQIGAPSAPVARGAAVAGGLVLMSLGGALYLSANLGASPIDGVMLGVHERTRRRTPLFLVRVAMELSALLIGWLAGGDIGIGTVIIGLGIGPGIHGFLFLFDAATLAALSGQMRLAVPESVRLAPS